MRKISSAMWVLARAAAAVVGAHASLTVASLVTGASARCPSRPPTRDDDEEASRVRAIVARMYSGGGLAAASCSHDVVFEDPAALCVGKSEVEEAFWAAAGNSPARARDDNQKRARCGDYCA